MSEAMPPTHACPLCRSAMEVRDRSNLRRFLGLAIIYVSVFLLIYSLPAYRPFAWAGGGLAIVAGWLVSRHHYRWWCETCCHAAPLDAAEREALERRLSE